MSGGRRKVMQNLNEKLESGNFLVISKDPDASAFIVTETWDIVRKISWIEAMYLLEEAIKND